MKKNIIIFILFFVISDIFSVDLKYYKDAILILPKTTKLSFEWLLYPDENLKNTSAILNVDNKGLLWIGANNNTIFNAENKILFKTDTPFIYFLWTDNGVMFFQTEKYLSFIPSNSKKAFKPEDGILTAPLQPLVSLPSENCKIKQATKSGLYFISKKDNKSFVYYSGEGGLKKVTDKSLAIAYKEIFVTDKDINSVSGNGKKTYVAIEKSILEVNTDEKKVKNIFTHPANEITDIAYYEGAGIFYATKNYIGFTGKNTSFDFIKTPDAKLLIKNNLLYVFIKGNCGVLKIKNIKDFINYKFK